MPLLELQRTLARLIRAPEGVAAALREDVSGTGAGAGAREFALQRAAPEALRLETLVRTDTRGAAATRLDIYANAYFFRILGVLEQDYPAVARHLGSDLFRDLVTSYLLVHPPRHASLRYAGLALADFLAGSEAAAGVRARAPWAADLAAFEWARVDAFDATDGKILTRDDVATRSVETFGDLALRLGSWVVIRSFDHPVDALFEDERIGQGEPHDGCSTQSSQPTCLIVWRLDEKVVHRRLDALEESALARVSLGASFGSLCEFAAGKVGEEASPGVAAGWLEQWLADGLLRAD